MTGLIKVSTSSLNGRGLWTIYRYLLSSHCLAQITGAKPLIGFVLTRESIRVTGTFYITVNCINSLNLLQVKDFLALLNYNFKVEETGQCLEYRFKRP